MTITSAVVATVFVLPPLLHLLSLTHLNLSSQPHATVPSEQASASKPNTYGAITLIAVTESQNSFGLLARPIDSATLADLPDHTPLDVGHHYIYAISPDHKTLAMITWPSGSNNAGGALRLIDLNSWTETPTDVGIDDYVGDLTFSADGKRLYWAKPTVRDPAHGLPRDFRLYQYDLDNHELSTIAQLPTSFMPWSQRLSSGNLAIFGIPTDVNNLAEDAPHILIINPERRRTVVDVRLDGVKAGQFYEQTISATSTPNGGSGQYVMYHPGLAWDLKRSLLYVVSPNEDKVMLVDLAKGVINEQTPIRRSQSFLEQITDLLLPVAQAKGGPEITTRATLNPNGDRLYVFSQELEDGLLRRAKLQVIATNGMREISYLDELLTDFALTPNGRSVLIVKGEIVNSHGFDMLVNRDVYVLDAETLQEHTHLRVNQADQLGLDGFSPDGRYAYLQGSSAQWIEGSGWRDWQTTWQLLDLNSLHLSPVSESKSNYAVLLNIVP
jgi:hypothetical protein